MNRELANPLQSFLRGAAQSLPASTGETARYRSRIESGSGSGSGSGTIILADVSSSMDEHAGDRKKIDLLREALAVCWSSGFRLIAFASVPAEVASPSLLPAPAGGTALHLALDAAAPFRPARTLVVTDGRPDSEADALAAADRLAGVIDTIYCGPDTDRAAIDFLQQLARQGAGRFTRCDLVRESASLTLAVRSSLGLPAPK